MMFFELDRGLVVVIHQWFSLLFLAGAAGHVTANIRPFKNHLRSAWGRASGLLCALIFALSLASWGMITGPQLKRPIEHALVGAPLPSLAGIVRTTPDALVARLEKHGVKADAERSVRELATASGVGGNRLLGIVFLDPAAPATR